MAGLIALYLRISLDDDNYSESDSVAHQRDLLRAYVSADPALSAYEVAEFADDGWSGTNFDRPRVQELLELARRGGVKCIIVKDLSRWGRSYTEVSEYIDRIFPFLGIRFISVNDHYDSNDYLGSTAPIDVAFGSIMHDVYSKELSTKVRQSYIRKANKGECVCGHPPFGYLRSEIKKNALVIDEGAACIVRRIFDLACTGMSGAKITAQLNEEGIDTAFDWQKRNGRPTRGRTWNKTERVFWSNAQVTRIIRDERYTGTLILFKSKREKIGSRKQVKLPESEWLKIPNAYEAIISVEQFSLANDKLRRNAKRKSYSNDPRRSPLTGKIFCGHCNHALLWRPIKNPYHFCGGVKAKYGKDCFDGRIQFNDLSGFVLSVVQTEAQKAYCIQRKRKQVMKNRSSDRDTLFAERKRIMMQIGVLERRFDALYEEFATGKLDKDAFAAARNKCNAEIANAETRVSELTTRLEGFVDIVALPDNEPLLQRILDATSLTDEVLALVDRVVVFDDKHIEVHIAFGDTNLLEVSNDE